MKKRRRAKSRDFNECNLPWDAELLSDNSDGSYLSDENDDNKEDGID